MFLLKRGSTYYLAFKNESGSEGQHIPKGVVSSDI
jgi:hypothetical protein